MSEAMDYHLDNIDMEQLITMKEQNKNTDIKESEIKKEAKLALIQSRRTAFVARFIVLRESRRTRAHRKIEQMSWNEETTCNELFERFKQAFIDNGDNMTPIDRDLRRALAHADRGLNHFIREYASRATLNFVDSLCDYERSNQLLFGDEEQPKSGGWRLIQELLKEREKQNA